MPRKRSYINRTEIDSLNNGLPGIEVPATYEKAIAVARSGMWQEITSSKAGSGSIAIMDGGKIVYAEGFGMADREKSIPINPDTLFNIGSVSKVFAAVAIMLLVDQGKVRLDDTVIKYLPDFTMADTGYKGITVRMLLNHTSGIPGTSVANCFYGYIYNSEIFQHTLATLSRSHLKYRPGAIRTYCNDGFTLAEMIVERVSGQKYIGFLAQNIFQPLSLEHSGLSVGQRPDEIAASYYQTDTGKKEPLQLLSVLGAGGLGSTPSDLCRFADTFSGSGTQILSEAALDEITREQPSELAGKLRNPEYSFGLGWDMTYRPLCQSQGIKVMSKSGGVFEYTTLLITSPSHRLSVAVTETGNSRSVFRICENVFQAVMVQKGLIKAAGHAVSFPPEQHNIPRELKMFEGYYIGERGMLFKIAFELQKATVTGYHSSTGKENSIVSLFYNSGYFNDDQGIRSYFSTVSGAIYHIISTSFGMDLINLQKLDEVQNPQHLKIDMNGKQWLRRNVKAFEGKTLSSSHVITSGLIDDLPGYVNFLGIKVIQSPEYAGMPGVVRDQVDLTLIDNNGQTWARNPEMVYSPSSIAKELGSGDNSATLGNSGYNEWLIAGQDAILTITIPDGGRVIVFSPAGSNIYDSAIDSGSVFIKQGSYVEMAGQPGNIFKVTAQFRE
jgi:CubicO group peptidase (beta-lactamase class C family)